MNVFDKVFYNSYLVIGKSKLKTVNKTVNKKKKPITKFRNRLIFK
ncbi:hypothetical protein C8P68_10213 [Mucilaginibacter yixingensis]|uniref:Uncharacterized protein n=1 Tax=Mucilaginibacter yixingensis TaxID=1295612 RepID=A0A2T5JBR2_9SPHI|nr:hypothetical protein C8P68_10213 [Mucilaginibacter yixingensis]